MSIPAISSLPASPYIPNPPAYPYGAAQAAAAGRPVPSQPTDLFPHRSGGGAPSPVFTPAGKPH